MTTQDETHHEVERLVDAIRHHDLGAHVLSGPFERACRRLARALTVFAVGGFAVAVIWLGVPGAGKYVPWQSTASVAALALAVTGLYLAYRWEAFGASMALVAGVSVGALAAIEYHPFVALIAALVFVAPAVLYFLAWHRTQTLRSIVALALITGSLMAGGGAVAWDYYAHGYGAAHPGSTTVAPPESAVTWMWSGGVTTDAAVVVAYVPDAALVELEVTSAVDPSDQRRVTSSSGGPFYRFELTGLDPGTGYRYEAVADGEADVQRAGSFATFPTGPTSFTVAVGACSRLGSNGAVFDAIAAEAPDLFLTPGDFFYGDIVDDSLDVYADAYEITLTQPAQAALYRQVPVAYVWDDHDYGADNAGADSPSRKSALAAYRLFTPHYPLPLPGDDAPIAQAFTVGRVRFILTDLRSARSDAGMPDGPDKSMLGDAQLAWFEAELLAASRSHALVVWASSLPWIAPASDDGDDWSAYASERERISRFLADNGIDNLVMVAGDAHMLAIDDGTHSNYANGDEPGFPVLHAGALDRPGSEKGGPYSEGAYPGGGQYGVLEVIDDGGDQIEVVLTGRDWTGDDLVTWSTTFPVEVSR